MENEKKVRKGEIKFNISLSGEQREAKQLILANDITLLRGSAGSGKSLLACQCALDGFFKGEYSKIIIARPAVSAGEDIGFLPGSEKEKIMGYLLPIFDNLMALYGDTKAKRDKIQKHIDENEIEICSVGKLRGRTFSNAFVIIDEFQNVTKPQAYLITTRLGINSRMVVTGDLKQSDIRGYNGLEKLISMSKRIDGIVDIELKMNHRKGIVKRIIEEWDNEEDNDNTNR